MELTDNDAGQGDQAEEVAAEFTKAVLKGRAVGMMRAGFGELALLVSAFYKSFQGVGLPEGLVRDMTRDLALEMMRSALTGRTEKASSEEGTEG